MDKYEDNGEDFVVCIVIFFEMKCVLKKLVFDGFNVDVRIDNVIMFYDLVKYQVFFVILGVNLVMMMFIFKFRDLLCERERLMFILVLFIFVVLFNLEKMMWFVSLFFQVVIVVDVELFKDKDEFVIFFWSFKKEIKIIMICCGEVVEVFDDYDIGCVREFFESRDVFQERKLLKFKFVFLGKKINVWLFMLVVVIVGVIVFVVKRKEEVKVVEVVVEVFGFRVIEGESVLVVVVEEK